MACAMPSTRASAEAAPAGAEAVLSLTGLTVSFATAQGPVVAARDVTLSVERGECLAVVGESGAGKSQAFLAVMGLLAANGRAEGSARFAGRELIGLPGAALDAVRGAGIGMVFQDPMTSLTPHLTIGDQLSEVLRHHARIPRRQLRECALQLLERVHVSDALRRLAQYPHELSGGMRQRVMIALALGSTPRLVILDEPTTALDVTIQAQILALLAELRGTHGLSLVLITHDLGAVAGVADRVAVMRAGSIVETGPVRALLSSPADAYTRRLVEQAAALHAGPAAQVRTHGPLILEVRDLAVQYRVRHAGLGAGTHLPALTAVSFEVRAGESLGIVGESGSGKSTLARAALQLLRAASGRILWLGRAPAELPPRELRALRRQAQIIFQDPLGSLDPRMTVAEILAEPLRVHEPALAADARAQAVRAALSQVGLAAELAPRYPHELSGGQCQRVGIARAMILRPQLLVCDEPLSALDVPTQQQIVTLLTQLLQSSGTALLFISHNLALVRRLCERVLVLYLGRMMELAPTARLYDRPLHPYSQELLASLPGMDPDVEARRLARVRSGEPPSPLTPPSGCVYRTRCPHAVALCAERVPLWEEPGAPGSADSPGGIACHRWRELR